MLVVGKLIASCACVVANGRAVIAKSTYIHRAVYSELVEGEGIDVNTEVLLDIFSPLSLFFLPTHTHSSQYCVHTHIDTHRDSDTHT